MARPSPPPLVPLALLAALLLTAPARSFEGPRAGPTASGTPPATLIPVGVASVDITPEGPIRLSGYGSRAHESEGVADRLEASALAIGGEEAPPAVLVTAELIGVSGRLTRRLAQRLAEDTPIDRTRLTLAVTHTHTGPMVRGVLPYIFGEPIPPAEQRRIDAYTDRLLDLLERVVREALADRAPARVSWGTGSVGFAANRRVIDNGRWTGFGIDPDGPVDLDLPVLRVRSPDGELRAVFLSYACHNTTLGPEFNRIHGDWAGRAESLIEERHPGTVVLIATGAGGDANPQPRGGLGSVRLHGRALAAEVEHLLDDELVPITSVPATEHRTIDLPLDPVPTPEELARWSEKEGAAGFYAGALLDSVEAGGSIPTHVRDYPLQVWRFGGELAMIFMGGEVVADYALRIRSEFDADRVWVSAYANAVPCYVASARVVREGGYEVVGSMHFYGVPAPLSTTVEDRIVETVRELVPDEYRTAR